MISRFAGIALLLLASALRAQAPYEQARARAVPYARQIPVSQLDRRLPKQPLNSWLTAVFGTQAKLQYDLTDCGEGGDGDPNRELPACVDVTAKLSDGREAVVSIMVGSSKVTISGRPEVFYVVMTERRERISLAALGDLPGALPQNRYTYIERVRQSPARNFDPQLPNVSLANWMVGLAPAAEFVDWRISPCERLPRQNWEKQDHPICATAGFIAGSGRRLDLAFRVATHLAEMRRDVLDPKVQFAWGELRRPNGQALRLSAEELHTLPDLLAAEPLP